MTFKESVDPIPVLTEDAPGVYSVDSDTEAIFVEIEKQKAAARTEEIDSLNTRIEALTRTLTEEQGPLHDEVLDLLLTKLSQAVGRLQKLQKEREGVTLH